MKNWRFVNVSTIGTSHMKSCKPVEDYSRCEIVKSGDSEILVAVASDGAGSAKMAARGSQLVCDFFIDNLTEYFISGRKITAITFETLIEAVMLLRGKIADEGTISGFSLHDYAATLLLSVISDDYSIFAQIGDGTIISSCVSSPNEYMWVSWPSQGEYANTTYFVTSDNPSSNMFFEYSTNPVERLLMITDGLQHLALVYSEKIVHQPFAEMLFNYLGKAPIDALSDLQAPLTSWLSSDIVTSRTDDDKTIILAMREY